MRILHAADVHLDSPLAGLAARAGGRANELVGATRRAFTGLVDYAIDNGVELLLIAGDLYDGDWKDFSTGLFFVSEMARLDKAGIRVAVVKGNHDAENHMTRSLSWPDNVRVFRADRAETWILEDLGMAVHGRSFAKRDVTENLAISYPEAKAGLLNIGLLHTDADGGRGHTSYAPCSLSDLVAKGYDYWALGHVHGRAVLSESPWIVFPGNLQGRDANETGAKGATLITVDCGAITDVEHVTLDVVRWAKLHIDLSGLPKDESPWRIVRERLADAVSESDGRTLALRLVFRGETHAHPLIAGDPEQTEAECAGAVEQCGGDVWLERVVIETTLPQEIDVPEADALHSLLAMIEEILRDPQQLLDFREELSFGLDRLPSKVRTMAGLADLDEATLALVLNGATATLRHRLQNSR